MLEKNRRQKRILMKAGKKLRCAVILLILLLAAAYLGIALYYTEGFSFGTWINGVYCTGKSVEEVNEELLEQEVSVELDVIYPICQGMELSEAERKSSHFVLDKETAKLDYTKALQKLLQKQQPLLWAENLFLPAGGHELTPAVIFAEDGKERFSKQFLADGTVRAEVNRESLVRLEKDDEEGILLYDGKRNRFDAQKALQECILAIEQGEKSILLSSACYYDEETDAAEIEQEKLYRELRDFLDFEIVYDMGTEQVRFDKKALVDLLATKDDETLSGQTEKEKAFSVIYRKDGSEIILARNEDGTFYFDKEKVEKAIETLAEHYDTYGKSRQFTTTDGKVVAVEKGTYGTELDQKTEKKWLLEALEKRQSETHTPAYSREAYARGENDIGDTYIEINITKQKLWFYQAGNLELETDVVTGDVAKRRKTPEGAYYVYGKQKKRILRGGGHPVLVDYWMPVKGGVGIHDADWRKEFGGEIYQNNGSHGCINLPPEKAEELYGMIEVGVPVVIYSEGDM